MFILKLVAYISAAVICIPFIVVFYFLHKQPYTHDTVKLLWLVGFSSGLLLAITTVFIVHPGELLKWYGVTIYGLSIFINGLEHFIWALEYFYSSENLIKATTNIEI